LCQVKELIVTCESPILQAIDAQLAEAHDEMEALAEQTAQNARARQTSQAGSRGVASQGDNRDTRRGTGASEGNWKWDGSSYVNTSTIEPWVEKCFVFTRVVPINHRLLL